MTLKRFRKTSVLWEAGGIKEAFFVSLSMGQVSTDPSSKCDEDAYFSKCFLSTL